MKRSRIFHNGRAIWAEVLASGDLSLKNGEIIKASEAKFMAPVTEGASIFALGLNYADHNKELGFAAKQAEPLIFIKGHATLTGHNCPTPREVDANQMHPECELVAIIGKPAKNVKAENALEYVSGYTIANDYAIREYLENYYRPNMRVKNRDATTPLGPWIVDASDIKDPQNLKLQTRVNGKLVQDGNTCDMVLSVAGLIEYLSGIMTLLPGDMILTGTPQGVEFVNPGDVIESEIENIGILINHVVAA